jgi:hypothetical protein
MMVCQQNFSDSCNYCGEGVPAILERLFEAWAEKKFEKNGICFVSCLGAIDI